MAESVRFVIRGTFDRSRHNYNFPAIKSRQSVVHITAAQVIPADPSTLLGGASQNFIYHLGEASVWVSNVSPHFNDHYAGEPGGVEFHLHVDWKEPIDVAVTITVEDKFPVAIDGYPG